MRLLVVSTDITVVKCLAQTPGKWEKKASIYEHWLLVTSWDSSCEDGRVWALAPFSLNSQHNLTQILCSVYVTLFLVPIMQHVLYSSPHFLAQVLPPVPPSFSSWLTPAYSPWKLSLEVTSSRKPFMLSSSFTPSWGMSHPQGPRKSQFTSICISQSF